MQIQKDGESEPKRRFSTGAKKYLWTLTSLVGKDWVPPNVWPNIQQAREKGIQQLKKDFSGRAGWYTISHTHIYTKTAGNAGIQRLLSVDITNYTNKRAETFKDDGEDRTTQMTCRLQFSVTLRKREVTTKSGFSQCEIKKCERHRGLMCVVF